MKVQKVITNNQSIVPFFGDRMSFIRGLDPLGLQNTSDATFTLLLPGLNNVTGRIRYYSFYCWLLDEYSKRNGSTDPEVQRKFIRTAEYMIALSSQFYEGDNGSIPGSNYAKAEIQDERISTHDLNAGIFNPDGTTANTYWNFGWGAFGQYYLGSMRDIGIITDRESSSVYVRTNSVEVGFVSGELLAQSFDQNIPSDKKELYFSCLENGSISEIQLQQLLPEFNLTIIPHGSEEQRLLTRLLLQKDYPHRIEEEPVILRNKTINHLLLFAQSEPEKFSDRQFVYYAYDGKGLKDSQMEQCLFGWYYYQFNEFWQYSNTSILNGALDYLESTYGPNWVALSEFVEELTGIILMRFQEDGLYEEQSGLLSDVLKKLNPDEYLYFNSAYRGSRVEKVFYSILLMFSLYLKNTEELVLLKRYGENNDLVKDGEGSGYFLLQFKFQLMSPLQDFIRGYLFKNIFYRHQYVAYRKMGNGGLSTQKFIIEDHHIRYLGNFEAGYTGPRIGSLISFLKDLNIISTENKMTEFGEDILNKITSTDD